ncbi:hypothetical protein K9M48_04585 [Candidatus Gracilibacteria bacterium]|nr:hypothetical protein [Candidatus Gracilibacteria bacterium]
MTKKYNYIKSLILYVLLGIFLLNAFSFAQVGSRGKYGSNPMQILDNIKDEANEDTEIQETALDGVTEYQGGYAKEYKIANTLEYFKNHIQPYLQRLIYIGLTVAVILLIYNGFLMVTNSIHKKGDFEAIKKNIINIGIGVIVLTGFYFIIKLMVAIINTIFGGFDGSSGFS